jgi:DNA helicase HerA-like ATPase
MNGTVVVFDTHGEYGRAFERGELRTNPGIETVEDERDQSALPRIIQNLNTLQTRGGGVIVATPQSPRFERKYSGANQHLALQFDHFDMDDIAEILPGIPEAQQRVLDVAIRQWRREQEEPRDIGVLIELLTTRLEDLRHVGDLSEAEQKALGSRSAGIAAMRLRRVINEAQSFYSAAVGQPTDLRSLLGRRGEGVGRLVIVDLQGLSDDARQIIVALISSEILHLAADSDDPLRPVFLVYEEGHNFAPTHGTSISRNIIKRIAAEGRKFGVGFSIISQRPSKLDPDVTSQCNTIIAMRIKNPEDQRFISKSSDMFSQSDIDELPSLSTGEALICGRSIPAPLLVKIGAKALRHGGESPKILDEWGPGNIF